VQSAIDARNKQSSHLQDVLSATLPVIIDCNAWGESMSEERGRLVFDITTSAVWSGPPCGIVRVESQFARWALTHFDDVAPAFFDPDMRWFRSVDPAMACSLLDQDTAFDGLSFVNPARKGRRKTDRIPEAVQPYARWVLQFRRTLLQTLERVRLTTPNRRTAAFADRVQRAIMSKKYRAIMVKPDGTRRANLPKEMAFGPPVNLTARDTLVCVGGGWAHNDITAITTSKRQLGFRFVLFCHDIIPEMFPQFLKAADVEMHWDYLRRAFEAADLVIFNSRTVEADVKAYCKTQGVALGATAVCLLGAVMGTQDVTAPLPSGLERERYAVLVSTIEPRKGHRVIYDAWLRLLEAGIPQRARFKLVFAGRKGWMVDDLMRDLENDARLAGTLVMLHDASDATVAALYRDAAFGLFPSRYEGYGLPLVEAFQHGKAVIASTGGALPEVAGNFSPCLDPTDMEAWQRMLATWIEDPAARHPYETRIRTSFRPRKWDEASREFFALARGGRSTHPADAAGLTPPGTAPAA
jgi:glycosyltransferase involved in cell wall biosynthesis